MFSVKKKEYEAPEMRVSWVEAESGFMTASNEKAKIKKESTIVVEDYTSFENEISFE